MLCVLAVQALCLRVWWFRGCDGGVFVGRCLACGLTQVLETLHLFISPLYQEDLSEN